MLIFLLYLFGILFLFHGLYQIWKYLITISSLENSKNEIIKNKIKNKIFVFVPVLHEEKNIKYILTNLLDQEYEKNLYQICVITTEKEYLNSSNHPNTVDLLNELKSRNINSDRLIHFHYPNKSGFKADQLRFAFDQIRKIKTDLEISNSFFLLLDADSLIDGNIISRFNSQIQDGIDFYQQPLLWFKNIDQINNPLMQSFCFLQSFFSISYEIPMFSNSFFSFRLKYLIGNGLLVRGSFLLKNKNFPPIIEDVRIGRIATFLRSGIKLVPGYIITETAKSYSVQAKQSSVWFFGCGLFISDYIHTIRFYKEKKLSDLIFILYGFFKAFRWMNKGLFHLLGIILSLALNNVLVLAIYIISLVTNTIIPTMIVWHDFTDRLQLLIGDKRKLSRIKFQSIVFSPFMFMINFIGPYIGLLKIIKFYLWKKVSLPKTER